MDVRETNTAAAGSGDTNPAPSAGARDLARTLFARESGAAPPADAIAPAAERIFMRLLAGLSRSFGPYGSSALLTRALTRAQKDYPALASLRVSTDENPTLLGCADAVRTRGAADFTEGVVGILMLLADLLGRLIGDDLAEQLLEQSTQLPGANGIVVTAKSADHVDAGAPSRGDVPQMVKDHER